MMIDACAVAVFTRTPAPGAVKTRLIPEVGAERATEIYQSLIGCTLDTVAASGLSPVVVWCTPSTDHPFLKTCADRFGLRLALQKGLTLGARMYNAAESMLKDQGRVLLIGCDCPELSAQDLRSADDILRKDADVVLGPAEDGGYYLIGMTRPVERVFADVEWGTPRVLMQTRANLKAAGMRWRELPVHWDVDRPEDLERYSLLRSVGAEPY